MKIYEQNVGLETPARRLKIARLRDFVKKGLFGIKFSFSSILCYSIPLLRANFTPPPPPPPKPPLLHIFLLFAPFPLFLFFFFLSPL
ncbi:MAG: hypothetical protein FWG98_06025, partial [Candidatus Cloacimonetes bacterium]|nr:hypothetical protein [Candidatus Cloacimonadota bacterium]